jgi:hypothetical protein
MLVRLVLQRRAQFCRARAAASAELPLRVFSQPARSSWPRGLSRLHDGSQYTPLEGAESKAGPQHPALAGAESEPVSSFDPLLRRLLSAGDVGSALTLLEEASAAELGLDAAHNALLSFAPSLASSFDAPVRQAHDAALEIDGRFDRLRGSIVCPAALRSTLNSIALLPVVGGERMSALDRLIALVIALPNWRLSRGLLRALIEQLADASPPDPARGFAFASVVTAAEAAAVEVAGSYEAMLAGEGSPRVLPRSVFFLPGGTARAFVEALSRLDAVGTHDGQSAVRAALRFATNQESIFRNGEVALSIANALVRLGLLTDARDWLGRADAAGAPSPDYYDRILSTRLASAVASEDADAVLLTTRDALSVRAALGPAAAQVVRFVAADKWAPATLRNDIFLATLVAGELEHHDIRYIFSQVARRAPTLIALARTALEIAREADALSRARAAAASALARRMQGGDNVRRVNADEKAESVSALKLSYFVYPPPKKIPFKTVHLNFVVQSLTALGHADGAIALALEAADAVAESLYFSAAPSIVTLDIINAASNLSAASAQKLATLAEKIASLNAAKSPLSSHLQIPSDRSEAEVQAIERAEAPSRNSTQAPDSTEAPFTERRLLQRDVSADEGVNAGSAPGSLAASATLSLRALDNNADKSEVAAFISALEDNTVKRVANSATAAALLNTAAAALYRLRDPVAAVQLLEDADRRFRVKAFGGDTLRSHVTGLLFSGDARSHGLERAHVPRVWGGDQVFGPSSTGAPKSPRLLPYSEVPFMQNFAEAKNVSAFDLSGVGDWLQLYRAAVCSAAVRGALRDVAWPNPQSVLAALAELRAAAPSQHADTPPVFAEESVVHLLGMFASSETLAFSSCGRDVSLSWTAADDVAGLVTSASPSGDRSGAFGSSSPFVFAGPLGARSLPRLKHAEATLPDTLHAQLPGVLAAIASQTSRGARAEMFKSVDEIMLRAMRSVAPMRALQLLLLLHREGAFGPERLARAPSLEVLAKPRTMVFDLRASRFDCSALFLISALTAIALKRALTPFAPRGRDCIVLLTGNGGNSVGGAVMKARLEWALRVEIGSGGVAFTTQTSSRAIFIHADALDSWCERAVE